MFHALGDVRVKKYDGKKKVYVCMCVCADLTILKQK